MTNFLPNYDAGGLELPSPNDAAIACSSRLVALIVERIEAQGGCIGFDEYMRMVLYEPGLGYYSGAEIKFGADGDFVTAPEISPLFGYCLAQQASALISQGCGASILEFGAGSGKLCADIIKSLAAIDSYLILDLSADLKQRQQAYLQAELSAQQFRKVKWLSALPQAFDGIIIANEVFDAMPVHLLAKRDDWLELGVAYAGDRFCWQFLDPGAAVSSAMRAIEARLGALPGEFRCALNLNYQPWFSALHEHCARAAVLIIDYGYEQARYYHPERSRGTVDCYYRHRLHFDPLIYPGLQDITAYVDFDAVADAAEAAGFATLGLVSQGHFLQQNGLLEEAQRLISQGSVKQQLMISQQVKTLSLPEAMGRQFKVLAVQKNCSVAMPAMRRGGAGG